MSTLPKSLLERHHQWIEIVNTGNIEAYAGLLTEDAIWMPPGRESIAGREKIKEWLKPFMDKFAYTFSITEVKIRVSGDWAFERARFMSKMTPVEGGDPMEHTGTFSVLWKRDSTDTWHIERYIDDTEL